MHIQEEIRYELKKTGEIYAGKYWKLIKVVIYLFWEN